MALICIHVLCHGLVFRQTMSDKKDNFNGVNGNELISRHCVNLTNLRASLLLNHNKIHVGISVLQLITAYTLNRSPLFVPFNEHFIIIQLLS